MKVDFSRLKPWFKQRWEPENRPWTLTWTHLFAWCLCWLDWTAWHRFPEFLIWLVFTGAAAPLWYWYRRAFSDGSIIRKRVYYSGCILPVWCWCTFTCYAMGWMALSVFFARAGLVISFFTGLLWVVWYVEKESIAIQYARLAEAKNKKSSLAKDAPLEYAGPLGSMGGPFAHFKFAERLWHPCDLNAWYYGEGRQKLHQSLGTVFSYTALFCFLVMLLTSLAGCSEIYEMPAGGGERKQVQQVVKVQKVIKKKFVINPLSAVLFNPPPIDEIKLQLLEITKHAYAVGYGQGEGAGFAGGTNRGKVRFIRLEYNGGDWDQDFGKGADLNLLIEYGIRTGHKVASKTESRKTSDLKNFPKRKSPPMVYITGQKNISMSKKDQKILRDYLLEKHGMIFADNGGSGRWHGQFFNMMRTVLPNVQPIKVPLDHPVHRVPYPIPFLPYVAPHGGKDAWGWVVDGRLAVYYHPGDIGDAWSDGHAGIKTEYWELCFQLGVNVIFYAHAEYNKWLDAVKQDED